MLDRWRARAAGRDQMRGAGPLANRLRRLSRLERLDEAHAFLKLHARAKGAEGRSFRKRWIQVSHDLLRDGHYDHTPEELAFGAKVAWRNHARCIGRLFWDSLVVRDRRKVSEPEAIFDDLCAHLREATGDGRLRSVISIYPPARPGEQPCYIESPQLIRYAGYLSSDGRLLGDFRAVEATRVARSLGWSTPAEPCAFDILPVILRDSCERRRLMALPPGVVREVPIEHPDHPDLARLGLRWYATPVVTDMVLTIGGIDYPCAPFNGFYVCTEIGSRNFADRGRYNLLPEVARSFGLDPTRRPPFWKDVALTELNRAVALSFQAAGVTMIDHHTASDQFMEFLARENAAGRRVSVDWRWVVPPQASSACEVFHLDLNDIRAVPNFYRSRGGDGLGLMPDTGNAYQSRLGRFLDRTRRAARGRGAHV
jgi:nitric-oxide synthase